MSYRTEILICIGCDREERYRIKVDKKYSGCFCQAIGSYHCSRCDSIRALARDGDSECKKYMENPKHWQIKTHNV